MNTGTSSYHEYEDLPNLSPPYHHHHSDNNSSSCKFRTRRQIKLKVRRKNANKRRWKGVHADFFFNSKGPNDGMGDGISIQNETCLLDTCSNSIEGELEVRSKSNKDVVQTPPTGNYNDDCDQVAAEFVDEEELFNMPILMDSMAEGLLLTPPAMSKGFRYNVWDDHNHDADDDDTVMDLTLWRH